jgi:hypothetical protein
MSIESLISQASQPKDVYLVLNNFRGLEWIMVPVKLFSFILSILYLSKKLN